MTYLDVIRVLKVAKMVAKNIGSGVSMIYDKKLNSVIITDGDSNDIFKFLKNKNIYYKLNWTSKFKVYYSEKIFCMVPVKLSIIDLIKIKKILNSCNIKKN